MIAKIGCIDHMDAFGRSWLEAAVRLMELSRLLYAP